MSAALPVVRPARAGDAPAVRRVLDAAFGPEEAAVIDAVLGELSARGLDEVLLLAEVGTEVVGVVGLSRGWVDARERLVDVLVLSPLAVLPALQRRGVGSRLLDAAARRGEEAGSPLLFLEGDPGYYRTQGWVEAAGLGLERPSLRIPSPACQVRLLPAYEPWMSGRLVYPDAWWRHDAVGLRDPLLAEVERSLEGEASGSLGP